MPFSLKTSCFKFRRNKKKKSKKLDKSGKVFSDIPPPVKIGEIMQQCEPIASSSVLTEDDTKNDLNHTVASNVSVNALTENSHVVLNENKDHDSSQDNDLKNNVCKYQEDVGAESHLTNSETDSLAISVHPEGGRIADSDATITEQNINKLLEASQDIDKFSTTVREVLQYSELHRFVEEIYFQKSYEIISNIKVSSNIGQEIEKLEAIENALNRLHQDIMQKDKIDNIMNVDMVITEHEDCDCLKSLTIDSNKSHLSIHSESKSPTPSSDASTLSPEKKASAATKDTVVMAELEGDKENSCKPLKTDSKICLVNSPDSNQKVAENSLIVQEESSEGMTLETADNNVLCDSERVIDDSKEFSEPESGNNSENLASKRTEDGCDANVSEQSQENNGNVIPVSEFIVDIHSDIDEDKIEDKIETNIESHTSEESIAHNIMHSKITECLNSNDICRVLDEETFSVNEFQDTHDANNDFIDLNLDLNPTDDQCIADCTEMSMENRNVSDTNLQLEYKANIFEEKITCNSGTTVGIYESQTVQSYDFEKGTAFNVYETSKSVKAENFSSDGNGTVEELSKAVEDITDHHADKHPDIDECSHLITKSNGISFNKISNNPKEGGDLQSFSDFAEDCSLSKTIKYDSDSVSAENFASPEQIQESFSENDRSLDDASKTIIKKNDAFNIHSKDGARRINMGLNFEGNEIPLSRIENENDKLSSEKEEQQQKYKLEISKKETNFINEKDHSKYFEEHETDRNSKDFICDSNADEDIQIELNLHEPGLKIYLKRGNCSLKSFSASPECITFSGNKNVENSESKLDSFQGKNSVLEIGDTREFGDGIFENKNIFHQRGVNVNEAVHSNNTCSYENDLDDNNDLKTYSECFKDILNTINENLTQSVIKLEKSDSVSDSQRKNVSLQGENEKILNKSVETAPSKNTEYCPDASEFSEEFREEKYQTENHHHFQQSHRNVPESSRQDDMKSQENHSSLLCFNENFQQMYISPTNEKNRLNTPNFYRNGSDRYPLMQEENGNYIMLLKNKGNENYNRMKYVSKYSLSDCSFSSESSKLSESENPKRQELKTIGNNNFMFSGTGDSGTDKKLANENDSFEIIKKNLEYPQDNTEFKRNTSKIKQNLLKIREGQKIKICITQKRSPTVKVKAARNCGIQGNNKYGGKIGKKFQRVDPIKLLSYFKQSSKDSQLAQTIKRKQSQIPKDDGTSLDANDRDEIEIRRKENINLFNQRKQSILSEMGPNIRIIPIKMIESLEIYPFKIEKLGLNRELNLLTKKNPMKEHSPQIQTSRTDKYKISDMHKKSPKKKGARHHLVSANFLCESDTETFSEGLEKMTPMRRKILDSSRSIRSPKYPLTLSSKVAENKGILQFKSVFLASPKRNVIAVLTEDKKDACKMKKKYKICSPDLDKYEIMSPKKLTGNAEDSSRPHPQHTQNYRATSPDHLRSKFDDVFKKYAGRGRINGDLISYKRSTEWLRDAGIVGKGITAEEATTAFKCAAGVKVALNKDDYRQFLKKMTRVKKLNYNEVYEKLCEASRRCIQA